MFIKPYLVTKHAIESYDILRRNNILLIFVPMHVDPSWHTSQQLHMCSEENSAIHHRVNWKCAPHRRATGIHLSPCYKTLQAVGCPISEIRPDCITGV